MRRYHIQGRDDYKKYSKLCGNVTRLVHTLKKLDASDPIRIELTDQLLEKYAIRAHLYCCFICVQLSFQQHLSGAGCMLLASSLPKKVFYNSKS